MTTAEFPFPPTSPDKAIEQMRRIRDDRPMTQVQYAHGGKVWAIHRHGAIRQMLEDRRFVRKPFATGEMEVPYPVQFPDFLKTTMQFADPPEHTRLRRLVAKAFTLRRVELLRGRTRAFAEDLLDAMERKGPPADLVQDYTLQVPIQVLSELLGVPAADRAKFTTWSQVMLSTNGLSEQELAEHGAALYTYLVELIAARRAEPADDLLSALAAAQEADDSLTDDEILPIAMLLLVAGFDNTANFATQGVLALLRNPDQLQVLLADIDGAAAKLPDEILRHGGFAVGRDVEGSAGLVPFVATEDVEIDGQLVRAGECVMADISTANHDEHVFEQPERFDITRSPNPHLTLSHGLHHCLGAPLARMEMQVIISSLFRRLPTLKLAGEEGYATDFLTGGLNRLPVTW
ncbi:cytochrome P450 [Nonomuraea bangladeshensis]|uniref:cytochrome P450 n=1 Tax=Nonomuraea bangladeshensis TaxID=404385 RepID=UPI003C2C8B08